MEESEDDDSPGPPKVKKMSLTDLEEPSMTTQERTARHRANMSAKKSTAVREKNRESHTVFRYIKIFVIIIYFINIILRDNMSVESATAVRELNQSC